jgi:hypothetical protein
MKVSQEKETNTSCYKDGWEHLYDEMAKLDILIHRQVLLFRNLYYTKGNNDEALPGLCIKDEEVDRVIETNRRGQVSYLPSLRRKH